MVSAAAFAALSLGGEPMGPVAGGLLIWKQALDRR